MKKCFVANVDGRTSEPLLVNLEKALKSNVKAQEQLDIINGDMFKAKFGDWNKKSIPEELSMRMRKGFPELHNKKGTDQWYFILEDGTKEFVQKRIYGDIPSQHHDHVIRTISKYYLDSMANLDINNMTKDSVKKLRLDRVVESYVENYLASLLSVKDQIIELRGEESYNSRVNNAKTILKNKTALKGGLEAYILSLGVDARKQQKNALALLEGETATNDETVSDGINIADSALTNQKDNVHANIKAFLHSIESVDGNGNSTANPYLSTKTFEPFDNVYDVLREHLTDLSAASDLDGGDLYVVMLAKLKIMKPVYPWMNGLVNRLEAFNEDKKSQFVQAFNQTRLNLYVTTVNNDEYRVMNATDLASREYVKIKEWGLKFKQNFNLMDSSSELNFTRLNEIINKVRLAQDKFNDTTKRHEDYLDLATAIKVGFKHLGVDINYDDLDTYIAYQGGTEFRERSFRELTTLIGYIGDSIKNQSDSGFFSNKDFVNPLALESGLKKVAKARSARDQNIKDSVVLLSKGVKMFAFTNPHHVNTKINQWYQDALAKKDAPDVATELEIYKLESNTANSEWLNWLTATDRKYSAKKRRQISIKRLSNFKAGLDSSFKTLKKNDGVGNTSINIYDDLNKSITKTLGQSTGMGKSLFSTLTPADKRRSITLEGFNMHRSGIGLNPDGTINVPKKSVDIGVGYFLDEFNRMKRVKFENDTFDDVDKVDNYHTLEKNGTKSQIFESLSMDSTDPATADIRKILYEPNSKGEYIGPLGTMDGFTKEQEAAVRAHVTKVIAYNVTVTVGKIRDLKNINKEILESYGGNKVALAGDYFMNGMISAVEYGKLFAGDPAYYKNLSDMIKRVPATYTDGLPLRLRKNDSETFNYSVADNVEGASRYYDKIYASLTDKSIAAAYKKVDTTDAQGWITPRRWRFLLQRAGKWTPMHDVTFSRMMNKQTLSPEQAAISAQPLKGVYYEINNGIPLYFKYSSAVLIPGLVDGTALEPLYNKMTKDNNGNELSFNDEIHEVITKSGVKVGASGRSRIHGRGADSNTLDPMFKLNKKTAYNKGWKLQQDLPIKTMHETKLGSQLQKNILMGLDIDSDYTINGEKMSGSDAVQRVHDAVSKLSNYGKQEIMNKFGIGEDGIIKDKSALYEALLRELRDAGGNDNMINALEQETDLDQIPQMRTRAQNLFMNMMDKAITDIETNGGSFIQVSPFGIESIKDGRTDRESGIKVISDTYDGKGLQPPRKSKDGKTILPGQVMLPHSQVTEMFNKLGLNISEMTGDEIKAMLTPGVLDIIGYRIPNQGLSSNDALEVVGILPEGSGDSVVGYDGMPAKTGHDYDIDKMFFMTSTIVYNEKTGKVEKVTEGKDGAKNDLISIYQSILLSPSNYDELMRSVDGTFLKKSITGNINNKETKLGDMEFFGPVHQLNTKYEYMTGQTGVGTAANQLVDSAIGSSIETGLNINLGIGTTVTTETGKIVTAFDKKNSNKHSISDILSAFLNANVDIANDNFITRGNHNAYTSTVTNLLVRSGVDLGFINEIMGSNVMKELVKTVLTSQGLTTRRVDSPIQETIKRLDLDVVGVESIQEGLLVSLYSDYKNGHLFSPNTSQEAKIIAAFSELLGLGKSLNESVLTSKIDTTGNGGSPISRMVMSNRIDAAANKSVNDETGIRGYQDKFKGTMLGTYTSSTIGWVGNVLDKNQLFVGSILETEAIYDDISKLINDNVGRVVDVKLAKTIENSLYTYLYSGTELLNNLNVKELATEVPVKIRELKKSYPDNFFLQNLSPSFNGNITFFGVEMNDEPVYFQNRVYNAWLDLYENPETKEFAVDMVKYSFMTSGFQNSLAKFHNNIPAEILRGEGFNRDMTNIKEQVSSGYINQEEFTEQFFKNNTENNTIVPLIKQADIMPLLSVEGSYAGFSYISPEVGGAVNPYYVRVKVQDLEGGDVYNVYKKIATSETEAIYMRTYRLGNKYKKFSIQEYNMFSGKNMKSILGVQEGPKQLQSSLRINSLNPTIVEGQKAVMLEAENPGMYEFNFFRSKKDLYLQSEANKKVVSDVDLIKENLDDIVENDNNLENDC